MRTMIGSLLPTLALWVVLDCSGHGCRALADQKPVRLTVEGIDQDLSDLPFVVEVPPARLTPGRYLLRGTSPGPDAPGLVYRDAGKVWLGFVLSRVPARSLLQFEVEPDRAPASAPAPGSITVIDRGQRIDVELDGHPWTTYVANDGPKPYFDPLIGPSQRPLTRAWPMREVAGEPHDHPHHRSLWFAHNNVNRSNTWDENPGHGSIRELARPTVVGGGPVGIIRTEDEWLDRSGRQVCDDERVVRFYATRAARIFDFEVTLKATTGSVTMGDNKDGVFGIRLAGPMAVTANQGGQILNSRGLKDRAAWGQAAEWVDYTGPVGGMTAGIAILNQPTSFRFPTTWHVRDYGLFAANPFGWHDFGQPNSGDYTIPRGESIRLAYRVVLHDGTTQEAGIGAIYHAYANPPRVTIP